MTDKSHAMWRQDGTLNHIGKPDWLTDDALQILMSAFEDAGFQIYAVGGCLRDTVLEHQLKQQLIENDPMNGGSLEPQASQTMSGTYGIVTDVDLSTNARPEETTRIIESLTFRGKPWKAIPTGIEHGTITAVVATRTYEITTFRKDVETDGRHAAVAFSELIEDDAIRRDFTINAFYADRTGRVIDIVGGSADLRERRIRFIGDPTERIKEDYLRILRFFRFSASIGKSGDGIDADGLAGCAMLADGLDSISRERIGSEMTRIICDPHAPWIVGVMEQSGVLNRILPGASVLTLARLINLEENYPVEGRTLLPNDMATRLASLGCADVAERLRLHKSDAKKIELVLKEAGTTMPPHELGYRHGYWSALHCLHLRWASLLQPYDRAALGEIDLGAQAEFPVKAADLMPAYSGKALGDRLNRLENAWIASKFSMAKDAVLALP